MTKDFSKLYFTVLLFAALIAIVYSPQAIPVLPVIGLTACLTAICILQYQALQKWYFNWKYSDICNFECRGHRFYYGLPKAFSGWLSENDISKERITGVAMRHPSGVIYAVLAPLRHHHVIFAMDTIGMAGIDNTQDQGFITNLGRYVGRIEAMYIARKAKQLLPPESINEKLYSEDLWD